MVGSNPLDLSLSLKPSYVPKSISNLLNGLKKINANSEKLSVLNDYLCKHQEELARIELFKRELPQCMLLLMDAIEILKEEALNIKEGVESEPKHPLMGFFPLKRKSCQRDQSETFENNPMASSSQLGNSNKKQKTALDKTQSANPEAFKPCRCCKCITKGSTIMPRESTSMAASGNRDKEVAQGSSDRVLNGRPKPSSSQPILNNNRRSWTPELHANFVQAVQKLGGPEVATPKKIKEVMNDVGLTNDQIKSHLQKYRLHHRNPPPNAEPAEFPTKFQQKWAPEMHYSGPWMPGSSQTNPPQGPIHVAGNAGGASTAGGNMENQAAKKFESYDWASPFPSFGGIG